MIISFVFPSEERLDRLVNLLKNEGNVVYHISLTCALDVLEKRIKRRNTQKIVSVQHALQCNSQIEILETDYSIDTTEKSPEQVVDSVYEIISKLTERKEIKND